MWWFFIFRNQISTIIPTLILKKIDMNRTEINWIKMRSMQLIIHALQELQLSAISNIYSYRHPHCLSSSIWIYGYLLFIFQGNLNFRCNRITFKWWFSFPVTHGFFWMNQLSSIQNYNFEIAWYATIFLTNNLNLVCKWLLIEVIPQTTELPRVSCSKKWMINL